MNSNNISSSIFIAIAPNHITNFESILKQNLHSGKPVLINPGNYNYNEQLWSQSINGTIDLQYVVSKKADKVFFQIKKIALYTSFFKKLKSQIGNFENVENEFYFCNLDDVLTNQVYYFFNSKSAFSNYVVEDGILNYYYPEINIKSLKIKRLIAFLFGLKFIPSLKHPTNIESNNIKAQYVRLPSKAIVNTKSRQLPFSEVSYIPDQNTILIIGQDIMHNGIDGVDYYEQKLNELFLAVQKGHDSKNKIVYKPHRNGNSKIAEELLQKYFKNYTLYKSLIPIEDCIQDINPYFIYSFESSAMLNLKIAIRNKEITFRVLPFSNISNITKLYKDLDITIL